MSGLRYSCTTIKEKMTGLIHLAPEMDIFLHSNTLNTHGGSGILTRSRMLDLFLPGQAGPSCLKLKVTLHCAVAPVFLKAMRNGRCIYYDH